MGDTRSTAPWVRLEDAQKRGRPRRKGNPSGRLVVASLGHACKGPFSTSRGINTRILEPPDNYHPGMDDPDAARDAVVGVWKLLEYHDRETESDSWTPTFGQRPTGILVYLPTGLLSGRSLLLPMIPRRPSAMSGTSAPMPSEARRDGEKIVGVVEHHMESAYPPELLDEGPDRPFRITGDQLTLGDGRTSRRLLKRVS